MKKFFLSLIVLISLTSVANSQTPEEKNAFLGYVFPGYMPKYVTDSMEVVLVTPEYAANHSKKYDYFYNLQTLAGNGKLRIGDTILVFNDQPFYSVGQNLFIASHEKVKKTKAPKTAEQKQQNKQVVGEIINGVLKTGANVLRNKNISSTAGGGVNF